MAGAIQRAINVIFGIQGADAGRTDIEKLRTATERWGDSGKQAAQTISESAGNIQRSFDRVEAKLEQGKNVTARDVTAMAVQYERFKDTVLASFGALERAPVEVQQALKTAEAQLTQTTAKVRQAKDTAEEFAQELDEGGQRWTGFTDATNKALGPLGAVQAKMLAVTAAFTAGWDVGMRLNKFFGTDMSEWDAAVDRIGKRFKVTITELSDQLVALGGVFAAVFTPGEGWTDRIIKAQQEYQQQVKRTEERLNDIGETIKKDEAAHRANAEAVEKAAKAHEEAADKVKKHAEEQEKLKAATEASLALQKEQAERVKAQTEADVAATNQLLAKVGGIKAETEATEQHVVAQEKSQALAQAIAISQGAQAAAAEDLARANAKGIDSVYGFVDAQSVFHIENTRARDSMKAVNDGLDEFRKNALKAGESSLEWTKNIGNAKTPLLDLLSQLDGTGEHWEKNTEKIREQRIELEKLAEAARAAGKAIADASTAEGT